MKSKFNDLVSLTGVFSPCKTDVVVTKGECYVYGYRFSANPKEEMVAREGNVVDADALASYMLDNVELGTSTGCLYKASLAVTGTVEGLVYDASFGRGDVKLAAGGLDFVTGGGLWENSPPCRINPSKDMPAPFDYIKVKGQAAPIQIGCRVPCIQVDARSNLYTSYPGNDYNFCTYEPNKVNVYEAAAAWAMIIMTVVNPASLLGTVGVTGTYAAVAVTGSRFLIAGGTSLAATKDIVENKWPGKYLGEGESGIVSDVVTMAHGIVDFAWNLGGKVLDVLGWAGSIVANPAAAGDNTAKALGGVVKTCTDGGTAFTVFYYLDKDMTIPMGEKPRLREGTYYLKIVSSEPLESPPGIKIDAEGTANDLEIYTETTALPNKNTGEASKYEFKYTRTIAYDRYAVGQIQELIYLRYGKGGETKLVEPKEIKTPFNPAFTDTRPRA